LWIWSARAYRVAVPIDAVPKFYGAVLAGKGVLLGTAASTYALLTASFEETGVTTFVIIVCVGVNYILL